MARTIQFVHKRRRFLVSQAVDIFNKEITFEHLVDSKGGTTYVLETPDLAEFLTIQPSLATPLLLKVGVAKCSDEDNYNKKIGRSIALGRMKEMPLFPTMVSADEIQLLSKELSVCFVIRRSKTDRIFFEEVV